MNGRGRATTSWCSRRMRRLPTWRRRRWRATSTSADTAGCRESAAAGGESGFMPSTRFSTVCSSSCPRPIRLLLLKDLRTFCRDPAQWSQFLIFFGLLAFYFLNIPRLGLRRSEPHVAQHGQLLESVGDGAHPLDVHQPVHLPAALARRAGISGFWACFRSGESKSSGASLLSRSGSRSWRRRGWCSSPT